MNDSAKLVAKKPTAKDRDHALKLTSAGMKFYQQLDNSDRQHNFSYSELAEIRCRCLASKGDVELAEKEKATLLKNLQSRSVKPKILKMLDKRLKLR